MRKHAAYVTLSVLAVVGVTVDAQDLLYRSVIPDDQIAADQLAGQAEVGVIALDPVNVGRTVQNAPYSAEAVTEITQTLADGNRIEHRTSASVARDSRGRTRREQHAIALGSIVAQHPHPIVTITDPSNREHLTLNYELKIAYRVNPIQLKLTEADREARGPVAFSESVGRRSRAMGQTQAVELRRAPGVDVRPPDDAIFDVPVAEAALPMRIEAAAAAAGVRFEGAIHREQLEARMIEGLRAEGVRTTMTIPAGAMGNALPIEVVSEQWYSPELHVVLLTRRSDPRFGETLYQLTNIDRAEPAPEFFTVPPDFRIEDMRKGSVMPLRPDGQS